MPSDSFPIHSVCLNNSNNKTWWTSSPRICTCNNNSKCLLNYSNSKCTNNSKWWCLIQANLNKINKQLLISKMHICLIKWEVNNNNPKWCMVRINLKTTRQIKCLDSNHSSQLKMQKQQIVQQQLHLLISLVEKLIK